MALRFEFQGYACSRSVSVQYGTFSKINDCSFSWPTLAKNGLFAVEWSRGCPSSLQSKNAKAQLNLVKGRQPSANESPFEKIYRIALRILPITVVIALSAFASSKCALDSFLEALAVCPAVCDHGPRRSPPHVYNIPNGTTSRGLVRLSEDYNREPVIFAAISSPDLWHSG
jgi:hypothetical protein